MLVYRGNDGYVGRDVRVGVLRQVLHNLLVPNSGLQCFSHAFAGDGPDEGVWQNHVASDE